MGDGAWWHSRTAVVCVSVGVLVVFGIASCGDESSPPAGEPATTSSAAVSVAPSTSLPATGPATVGPTVAPVSSAKPVRSWGSPSEAAAALFGAWTTGNRAVADAEVWAAGAEVDKLFATEVIAGPKNRGCDDGFGGMAQCFIANGKGGIDIDLTALAGGGWVVTSISPFSGG